jgi:hypothetical protein
MQARRITGTTLCLLAFLSACESQESASRLPTASPQYAAQAATMNPQELRRTAGVDRLPAPADYRAMQASMRRHWPADPRAEGASVTLDVSVDETGQVTSVQPVKLAANGGMPTRMILQERDGSERVHEVRRDPSVAPAAEAVLREIQFTPAMRDGEPVAHTFRMTISFTPNTRGPR